MCGIPLPPPKPPLDAVTGRRLTFDQAVAHVGGLDNLLSEHGKHSIRLNAKQYLWKYPNKTTWCTACGKPIEGFTGRHGCLYACPVCGARAEFRYEAKGHRRVYDEFVLYEWRRSVLDAETVTLTATWARRDSTRGHQPHLEPIQTSPSAIYVFRPGKAVTVYKKDSYWGRYKADTPWQRVDAIHPEHTKAGTYNGADIVIDRDQFRAALEGTRIGRVFDSLREASGRWDDLELMAVANCARRPWLEYLAKCGQAGLAGALMRMPHISKDIVPNQRARNPRELLGLTAGQWGEIKRDGIQLKARTLAALRLLTRLDIGPVKVADALALDRADAYGIERLLPKQGKSGGETLGDKLVMLPGKVRRKIVRRCIREPRHIQEWIDYYSQLRELGEVSVYGAKPKANYSDHRPFAPDADPALLLPKDVHAMHQRMTERLELLRNEARIKAAEALRSKFEGEILPKLVKAYTFEAEGLVLRPYATAAEVITEGSALSICIGGYAERYMRGGTVICCLRKDSAPDEPWRAVEFDARTGALLQDRGYKNDVGKWKKTPETKALLERFWRAFDAAHSKRKGKERKSA
jgi:predicted RNA-binding Zn-ribbon protein involved in translation (DUF1610 family)